MAEQKKKSRRGQDAEPAPAPKIQPKNESNQFWSVMLFAGGILSLLLIVVPGSAAWNGLHTFLFGMFGVAAAFIPVMLIYTAVLIGMER